jgi:hypothetical protein
VILYCWGRMRRRLLLCQGRYCCFQVDIPMFAEVHALITATRVPVVSSMSSYEIIPSSCWMPRNAGDLQMCRMSWCKFGHDRVAPHQSTATASRDGRQAGRCEIPVLPVWRCLTVRPPPIRTPLRCRQDHTHSLPEPPFGLGSYSYPLRRPGAF